MFYTFIRLVNGGQQIKKFLCNTNQINRISACASQVKFCWNLLFVIMHVADVATQSCYIFECFTNQITEKINREFKSIPFCILTNYTCCFWEESCEDLISLSITLISDIKQNQKPLPNRWSGLVEVLGSFVRSSSWSLGISDCTGEASPWFYNPWLK